MTRPRRSSRSAWICGWLGVAVVLSACGSASPGSAAPTAAGEASGCCAFSRAVVEIETSGGSVLIDAEVADSTAERQRGLMFREELPPNAGMVLVYERPASEGLWMKNTLIPLSAAFFDTEGRIIEIVDMQPCRADPCPIHAPAAEYIGALEVNLGAFDSWGVEVGDRLTLREA